MEEEEEDLPRKGPLRRCLATGRIRPKEEMFRFVVGPDGQLFPDLAAKLPGRGLWLSPERFVVNTAIKKGLFSKAARQKVTVEDGLPEKLLELAGRRSLELLGLARRAGLVVAGFDQVAEALAKGSVAFRLEASDGAKDGRRKLDGKARDVTTFAPFTAQQLGNALGREQMVHIAVLPGGLAKRLKLELNRLGALMDIQAEAASEQDVK